MELLLAVMIGIGLSISAGFRVFTPLLVAGLAARFDILPLGSGFEWISSTPALVAFSIALVLEIACNYIPYVDNLMKAIATPLAVVAGTLLSVSVIGVDESPFLAWGLAFVTGGGTATVSQLTSATVRGASTVTTGGIANPAISFVEGITSVIVSILSIIVPIIVVLFFIVILIFFTRLIKKRKAYR